MNSEYSIQEGAGFTEFIFKFIGFLVVLFLIWLFVQSGRRFSAFHGGPFL